MLKEYKKLINFLKEYYSIYTVRDYLIKKLSSNFVILRHDVDLMPKNALKMAELEDKLGIRATYYFRYPYTFKPEIIRKIGRLGHEIGYHYEVLSKAKGDYEKAIKLFEYELDEFKKITDVKTICMHGSPLSKYDNRTLWERYNYKDYGILGEAYLSIKDPEIYYITDTGRNWENRSNIRDKFVWKSISREIKTTEQLINILSEVKPRKLYITVHPDRWGYNPLNWAVGYLKDLAFNVGKKVVHLWFITLR